MNKSLRILAISEHYDPIVGGTTTYVKKVCHYLREAGVDIRLIHPGPQTFGEIQYASDPFPRISIGLGVNIKTHYHRNLRYQFVDLVNAFIQKEIEAGKVDLVHVLFGLFLTEKLAVESFRQQGIRVFNTIHNVPPEECSLTWKGDSPIPYWKEKLRLRLVKYKNHQRLKSRAYDTYVVPSDMVRRSLLNVLPDAKAEVVWHGFSLPPQERNDSQEESQLKLLTVGGFVPHKNQHLAVEVAHALRQRGLNFSWDMIGPNRHGRYVDFVRKKIQAYGLGESVRLHIEIPLEALLGHYRNSDLYVQLSKEEGFCLTTLDAAMFGLPLVGTPAGAIPEMIEIAGGFLTEARKEVLVESILHAAKVRPRSDSEAIRKTFTWEKATEKMISLYHE